MSPDMVVESLTRTLTLAGVVSAPLLGAALVVGVIVGVFQAATQVQETALAFVPKLLAAAAVLALTGPWALEKLVAFTQAVIGDIAHLAGGTF
jgi:flagellar biosynthetic protein FliQ